jgi:hypothetical protein
VPRHEVLGKRWLSQPVLIAATSFFVYPEKEVAVHQNGQTDMRKEVRSGKEVRSEKRWLTLTSMNDSHLFSHG